MNAPNSNSPSYRVTTPDIEYWRDQIKCQRACPVHTDARGYVRAIADGNDELAYLIARGPNPLASICGRVCGAPCEANCRRGDYDQPISIRALKRYVCERFGPESRSDGGKGLVQFLTDAAKKYAPRQCQDQEELLPLLQSMTKGTFPKAEGKSVGIIGSGPAGLGCAHDLAMLGFEVTIYEMESVLAGMLALGIPEYRLPRILIRAEVEVIAAMGVKARTNCKVGEDATLAELREKHDAVVIAVGAKSSRKLPIPGADAKGVMGGVEFLREVSLGAPPDLGGDTVVIGGGNVAFDVGRTVLRQTSVDAARVALRAGGRKVYLCSLESLEEMPADDIEIHEGDEEGIIRRNSLGPKEILVKDGKVAGVRFQRCLRVFDSEGRFNPQFDENNITDIPCDSVLLSIGQAFDLRFVDPEKDGIKMTGRGLIECDPLTGATSADDVFVAGDLAHGCKLLIHAVASGKAVARAIYEKTMGRKIAIDATELHFPIPDYKREDGFEKQRRLTPPVLPPGERVKSQSAIVEKGFNEAQARIEASRCFNCGVNTIFDGERCVLCGGCVDVCPSRCLNIVPAADIAGPEELEELKKMCAADAGLSLNDISAIIKDETICIRCALCYERCPSGAISMENFQFQSLPCLK